MIHEKNEKTSRKRSNTRHHVGNENKLTAWGIFLSNIRENVFFSFGYTHTIAFYLKSPVSRTIFEIERFRTNCSPVYIGDKTLKFQVFFPQNGTAVLKRDKRGTPTPAAVRLSTCASESPASPPPPSPPPPPESAMIVARVLFVKFWRRDW